MIPILDLEEALRPGAARSREVAQQLRAAAMGPGFFYVRNHGIADERLQQQFELAKRLFELPLARRRALSMLNSPNLRGFEILGEQTLDAAMKPDVKESFCCGLDWPADHPYVKAGYFSYGPSQWPDELPEAKPLCEDWMARMIALAQRLMQLMALSLDLPEHFFDRDCHDPMVTLRMAYYPPHPADADERTFGAGAHTDWGAVTILAQDSHGGLEVQLPDGHWEAAPPLPGCFVVNLGDMVPRWTNGLYRSNPHRVRNLHSGGAPRYSLPFFYEPNYLARIEAVPGTVPAGEAPRFAPCTAGEHLQQMYDQTYGLKAKAAAA